MLKNFINKQKGQINTWIIGIVIVVLVILGGALLLQNSSQSNQEISTKEEQENQVKASVEIRYNQDQADVFAEVEIGEGKTALDLTKKVGDVVTSGEGEMAFVTKINDREADSSKNEFWELVINGESAQVGAGVYKVKDGDNIAWKISKF